ncbi:MULTISPECIES: hypothetical protein [Xanthomonas translucens group]|uniref:hypothetical protein n=1 Tax=Xanthomonas translucens group TaxID=3390202 RepID=UPI0009B90670|nr:hypothetical protein [Xanthomonas translucens]UKE47390.1 hypothetical protein KHA79_01215 [Xanthomonas translucens pv. cerealis]UKE69738.1 hypothetical protein K8O61_01220 [Xanthomonas translucens pv. pistacia]
MRKPARLFFPIRPIRSLGQLSIALLCIGLMCGFRPCAPPPASTAPVVLRVIDRDADGADLPQYAQRGGRWIAATPGHRYALHLTNRSDRRVLSVDGVNAVSGQTASSDQRGYVLAPWQSTEIAGWRKSQREVAQFVFTDLADSYAARTGRPDNVGVIGMAVFDEAPTMVPQASVAQRRKRAEAPMPAAAAMAAAPVQERDAAQGEAQRVGTGHGEREWSPSRVTEFERASDLPQQRLQLRYDSHARLVARGVIPQPRRYPRVADVPQAFPGDFVADPPAY